MWTQIFFYFEICCVLCFLKCIFLPYLCFTLLFWCFCKIVGFFFKLPHNLKNVKLPVFLCFLKCLFFKMLCFYCGLLSDFALFPLPSYLSVLCFVFFLLIVFFPPKLLCFVSLGHRTCLFIYITHTVARGLINRGVKVVTWGHSWWVCVCLKSYTDVMFATKLIDFKRQSYYTGSLLPAGSAYFL